MQDNEAAQMKAEQVQLEKLAVLDLVVALFAQQDCTTKHGLQILRALAPLINFEKGPIQTNVTQRRLDFLVQVCAISVQPFAPLRNAIQHM